MRQSSSGDDSVRTPVTPYVERYDPLQHDCSGFTCGNLALDAYIHDTVTRDEQHHTAATYVLVYGSDSASPRRAIGYFTLSGFALSRRQAQRRDRDKYLGIYDPVPAVLIGRLALDVAFQGQGVGRSLLVSALREILLIRERLGVAVAVVHAIDDAAAEFYEHQGFTRFRDEPRHLYFPLAPFAARLSEGEE